MKIKLKIYYREADVKHTGFGEYTYKRVFYDDFYTCMLRNSLHIAAYISKITNHHDNFNTYETMDWTEVTIKYPIKERKLIKDELMQLLSDKTVNKWFRVMM